MSRLLLVLLMLAGPPAPWSPTGIPTGRTRHRHRLEHCCASAPQRRRARCRSPRGQSGEFTLRAKVNGVAAPMVVDTGATWWC